LEKLNEILAIVAVKEHKDLGALTFLKVDIKFYSI
jgi:hypothetical protein